MTKKLKVLWKEGAIRGVEVGCLVPDEDERGWLSELWRCDESTAEMKPAMVYVSETNKDVVRGPHEHERQTDVFVFLGRFEVRLWDARKGSKGVRMTFKSGGRPLKVVVPPGVVHAYRSLDDGQLVLNMPNRLYKGMDKKGDVDEIRHEDDKDSPYSMD
jgi:dTDP-4-dehydrorhamnose 3,5-epimerase